jgi:hypothetical protein
MDISSLQLAVCAEIGYIVYGIVDTGRKALELHGFFVASTLTTKPRTIQTMQRATQAARQPQTNQCLSATCGHV